MGHLATVATWYFPCTRLKGRGFGIGLMGYSSLNQWALDFEGNAERVIESIRIARERGAKLRVGPELEITYVRPFKPFFAHHHRRWAYKEGRGSGYGCLDHFLEGDTYLHSWEMMARILTHEDCQDILLDIGM
jgi:NAD+ synthase (glutamine-hydrolysing)